MYAIVLESHNTAAEVVEINPDKHVSENRFARVVASLALQGYIQTFIHTSEQLVGRLKLICMTHQQTCDQMNVSLHYRKVYN